MYFIFVGILSPFFIISMRGKELNIAQKASCIFMLACLYLLGISVF